MGLQPVSPQNHKISARQLHDGLNFPLVARGEVDSISNGGPETRLPSPAKTAHVNTTSIGAGYDTSVQIGGDVRS